MYAYEYDSIKRNSSIDIGKILEGIILQNFEMDEMTNGNYRFK
jgi:hypothetical protein